MEEERIESKREFPIFTDIRRYACEYCGIVRSKKSIINSHIQSHHQDEIKKKEHDGQAENEGKKLNVCKECGVSFRKPAYLTQHMQSHSLERQFTCPIGDCHSSYRRKDHLTRHLLQHQGKLFECPIENCKSKFSIKGNMTRHVREMHDDSASTSGDNDGTKQYICAEPGCGKGFKYASKLRKHEESHVRLETVEAFCAEPGCMKYFTNEQCLKAHLQSCHQHISCEVCGSKQLKKNIKRHLRTHEVVSKERIKCSFEECNLTFSTSSNLHQHIKAAHFEEKPYACSISGCGMRFSFKHVRDNHEKRHAYTLGDFVEADDEFQTRARGGRKRKLPAAIDGLMRKRVLPPSGSDETIQGPDYLSWLLSSGDEES